MNVSRLNVTHLRNMVTERPGEMPANQIGSNPLNDVRQATRELSLATLRSVQHLIDRIKSLLPDLALRDRRRQYRGLANFIGDVSSYLFGTATESDIDGLRQEIRKIKDWAGTAKTDNERTREGLATFTRLSNTRFDAMRDILDRDQKALELLHRQAQYATSQLHLLDIIISFSLREPADYVSLHDSVQELEMGIEDLIGGKLTPRMITVEQLGEAILNVSEALSAEGTSPFRLCQTTPQDIYRNPSYDFVRHGNELFIMLRLPYSSHQPMIAYRIHTFPMKVPGDQGFITQLTDFPKFVVTRLATGLVGELSELPRNELIESSSIEWHGSDSCASKLLTDRTDDIHEVCRFTARRAEIVPSWLRLGRNAFVLSNLTNITLICGRNDSAKPAPFTESCTTCFLKLTCGCRILAHSGLSLLDSARKEHEIELGTCNYLSEIRPAVLHTVNLAVMRHFYDMTNTSINGRDLFAPSRLEEQPAVNWPLFSDNMSGILARDKEAGYDLGKLAESLQNDSVVYHSPSEKALDDLYDRLQQFKLTKFEIGLLLGIGLLIVSQIVLTVKVKRHGHTMHKMALAILGISKNIPMTEAFILKNAPAAEVIDAIPASSVDPYFWLEWGPYYLASAVLLFSIAVTLGCLKVALSRRGFVYIEIGNDSEAIELKVTELPSGGRSYGLRTSTRSLRVVLDECWFGSRIHFISNHWVFYHFNIGRDTDLPTSKWLTPWTARKVRRILRGEHDILTFLVYTHHYIIQKASHSLDLMASAPSHEGLVDANNYNYPQDSVM